MSNKNQTLTPIEAINEFYRLKNKYEIDYYDKYVKPILRSRLNKREKRVEYSRLPQHECINCKRNVGTIFTIKTNNEDLIKQYIAKCGDLNDPCPLDIQINYSIRQQLDKIIFDTLKDIDLIKLDIIQKKNEQLFFNKDILTQFGEKIDELKQQTEYAGRAIEMNILKNNNPEKHLLLRKTIDEFSKGCILPFKQMIQDFDDNSDESKLKQAVEFYINEMIPKLKEIQSLKYDVNIVEYDDETNIYNLIQLPNSLENSEFCMETDDSVISFVKGVKKASKSKTMKKDIEVDVNVKRTKRKTKKIKPIDNLVLEEDVEEIPAQDEEDIIVLQSKFQDKSPEYAPESPAFVPVPELNPEEQSNMLNTSINQGNVVGSTVSPNIQQTVSPVGSIVSPVGSIVSPVGSIVSPNTGSTVSPNTGSTVSPIIPLSDE
jgi:hypothetical protein